jgi:dipeptidyl aminopeptidase/acylaminoacyl peptidase
LAFDHVKVAEILTDALGQSVDAEKLPINELDFTDNPNRLRLIGKNKSWVLDLKTSELGEITSSVNEPLLLEPPEAIRPSGSNGPETYVTFRNVTDHIIRLVWVSGDGGRHLYEVIGDKSEFKQHTYANHVWLIETDIHWSPDSTRLAALRTLKEEEHLVNVVESSPNDQLQPKLHSFKYLKPGDRVAKQRPKLFNVSKRQEIQIEQGLFNNPWRINRIRWAKNSREFTFDYNERGHQVLRIISVNSRNGKTKPVVEETSNTFVDYSQKHYEYWLGDGEELIWVSERNGWNHLYLFDTRKKKLKNAITQGDWVVRKVEHIDESRRQIWFQAMGIYPKQDPYYIHHCRVNLDGTGLTVLTEGNGTHELQWSPDRRFFVDKWSRVDQPPVHELRSADGKFVCELERADCVQLYKTGWKLPERFVAKGRDGETDIFGVIWRPTNFDRMKRYPVIESIYAGPHSFYVPKAFRDYYGQQRMAELGFILVQIDGMGTNWRSKKFHDVCWKNIKDAGFPDRILWIQAAANKHPEMDLSNVGIYGGSAGGQNTMSGLLHHGNFYKVGVSDCGCHDNRMDKIWWNEAWMGWPIGPEYSQNSNVTHAHKLKGKLLLIVGELDRNVDPASTTQVVNALIKADKDFDFLLIPGTGHGAAGTPYGRRRQMDFFVEHILKRKPRWE